MRSTNPHNNELIKSYSKMPVAQVTATIEGSQMAFYSWKSTSFVQRGMFMKKAADILRNNCDQYANLITLEMGKTITESRLEIEKCAWVCDYYAKNAKEILKPNIIKSDSTKSYVRFDPIGIVFAVMPWNFPFWQVFRFAAPTLMAGNVGLLKHASNVSGCALAIEDIFKQAGFPANIFSTLLIDKDQTSQVIAHKYVKAVSLTGSLEAGKSVASQAGAHAKKSLLELGGSDAYIVLQDANLNKAAELCVKSRMINGGQSCIAAKRFIVEGSVYDDFIEKIKAQMQSYVMGDPAKDNTNLGPMASIEHRNAIHQQVLKSIESGANCVLGGVIPDLEGAYYPPTILIGVSQKMPAYYEEIFGPVASVIKVRDSEEAIKIANDSDFGLGGAIFSADTEHAENMASQIDTGSVAINGFVKSDPRLPFGGVKNSGYGRELAEFGVREFVNIKTITVS